MTHPIVETKWQLDKIRALVNQIDTELDEAEYQAAQAEEVIEQDSKWEEAKDNVDSLAQQALSELEGIEHLDGSDIEDIKSRTVFAALKLKDILKELEK